VGGDAVGGGGAGGGGGGGGVKPNVALGCQHYHRQAQTV
jgi:hypothetical protein